MQHVQRKIDSHGWYDALCLCTQQLNRVTLRCRRDIVTATLLRLHPVAAAGVASDAVASDPDSAPASHDGAPEQKDQPIVCASASVASGDESGPSESEASAPREWIDLPATSEAMGRRFYRKKLPDLGDMVIVKVLAIAEMVRRIALHSSSSITYNGPGRLLRRHRVHTLSCLSTDAWRE